ncbi:hypothetical protein [Sinorhizobium sp. A49]|uniref:hypothetical protein n=1 Tax=Sinorhizobium sp. A49 TaxID=1945861 RepID=UPI0015C5477B|nr:hypothetical protein [Sinorhizobium sp. A49]
MRIASKVEYFLDQTPHLTILKNTNSDRESLFGTKPVSRKNIAIQKCTAYANGTLAGKKAGGDVAATAEFFRGHWKGYAGILLFRGPVEVTIDSVDGNRAVGSTYFPGDGTSEQVDGTIQGNSLRYSYTDLERMNITLTKKGQNSLSYTGVGEGGTVTSTLTRQ